MMPDPSSPQTSAPDPVTALLEKWHTTIKAVSRGPWKPAYRTWTEYSDERCAEARIHDYDGTPIAITFLSDLLESDNADEVEQFIITARTAMPLLLGALEAVLKAHNPGTDGRCQWCRNPDGQRAVFPCGEYLTIRRALAGEGAGDAEKR